MGFVFKEFSFLSFELEFVLIRLILRLMKLIASIGDRPCSSDSSISFVSSRHRDANIELYRKRERRSRTILDRCLSGRFDFWPENDFHRRVVVVDPRASLLAQLMTHRVRSWKNLCGARDSSQVSRHVIERRREDHVARSKYNVCDRILLKLGYLDVPFFFPFITRGTRS